MKKIALIALFACLMTACDENTKINIKYDNSEHYNVGDATLEQPISAISVDWLCGDVDICYTDSNAVRIYEQVDEVIIPMTDTLRMRYYVDEEGELDIQYCGKGRFRHGDLQNLRKHLFIEVPRGMELEKIDIDGVEARVIIENVVSREVTIDGVTVNVNACYPDTLPDDIDVDGVKCLLALQVNPAAGLTIDMSGIAPWLSCELPSRKEGEKTIVGDGRCKVDADGVSVTLSVRELK